MLIRVETEISPDLALAYIRTKVTGAESIFTGTVRNHSDGKSVVKLHFECYREMALSEMEKIAVAAKEKYSIERLAMLHACGVKYPGETVVIIAVAAAHRDAAFDACRFCIDQLKRSVPIWKREFYADGAVWVSAFP